LKKVLVTLMGLLHAPAVIRRPENCAPLAPPRYAPAWEYKVYLIVIKSNLAVTPTSKAKSAIKPLPHKLEGICE